MNRAYAVPVSAKVTETPEMDGLGHVTEEEKAEGILRLEEGALTLEVELTASTLRMTGMGQKTETEDLGLHQFRVPFEDLVSLTVHRRWFAPYVRLQVSRLDLLRGLPGAAQGVVKLRIGYGNWHAARMLSAECEIAQADRVLAEARKLESPDPPLLEGGD